MTVEDVLIMYDRDGGSLYIKDGDSVDRKNSVRVSSVQARIMKAFQDDIIALKGNGLAKKKAGK